MNNTGGYLHALRSPMCAPQVDENKKETCISVLAAQHSPREQKSDIHVPQPSRASAAKTRLAGE